MNPNLLLDHDAPAPDGTVTVRALLRIEGAAPEDRERVPLNLSLVLDRSSSMAGGKLAAARDAASLLVQRLWPEDVVSVVAYNQDVEVVAPPAPGAEAPDLSRRIAAITAGGMTNLSGGWLKGQEFLSRERRPEGLHRILLLTDGQANVGITEPSALTELCRTAASMGVTTTTIGFGAGFDEELLSRMADAGGGNSYYIERVDQAAPVFEEELSGLLSVAAQNVSVEIRPSSDSTRVTVHHDYPMNRTEDGIRLEIGDLYAREPRSVLVEFTLAGPAGADLLSLGTLVVRGTVLMKGGDLERREISCPVEMVPGEGPRVDPEIQRERLLLESGRARERALDLERLGDFDGAARELRNAVTWVQESGLGDDARLREEVADLVSMSMTVREGPLTSLDRKHLHQRRGAVLRSRGDAYKLNERRPEA